jgi:hypothetical protein
MSEPAFTCPRCGAESWNPHDAEKGFCARCDRVVVEAPPPFAFIRGTEHGGSVYEGMPCIICHQPVAEGEGAQAMPPLPAIHTKCMMATSAALDGEDG